MKLVERVSGFPGDRSGSPCWRSVSLQVCRLQLRTEPAMAYRLPTIWPCTVHLFATAWGMVDRVEAQFGV